MKMEPIKKVSISIFFIGIMVATIASLVIGDSIAANNQVGLVVGYVLLFEFFMLFLIGREIGLNHGKAGYIEKIQRYIKFAGIGVGMFGLAFIVFYWNSNLVLLFVGIFIIVIAAIIEEVLAKYTPAKKSA
jgi:uncharacterized membrane protein